MQNAALSAALLDFVYVPFAVTPENLERAVTGLKSLGVRGFNVTIPHKTAIIPLLDRLDPSASAAGAVNTVVRRGTDFVGYNTDGAGLIASLYADLDFTPGDDQILVVGAGGAARGAIHALCRAGASRILICNRSRDNALAITLEMRSRFPGTRIDVTGQQEISSEDLAATSLLVNCTSLGMNGERIACINLAHLPNHARVYDMVYSHAGTLLVKEAESFGLAASNGLGMLIAQGELAFELWTGQKPPEGVMKRALDSICRS